MKLKDKTIVLHQLFMWFCTSLNAAVTFLSLYFSTNESKFILLALASFFLLMFEGINQIGDAIKLESLGKVVPVIEYLLAFVLSILEIYYLCKFSCTIGIILLLILIPIETAIIPLIAYRYKIRNKILKHLKKRKDKKKRES